MCNEMTTYLTPREVGIGNGNSRGKKYIEK